MNSPVQAVPFPGWTLLLAGAAVALLAYLVATAIGRLVPVHRRRFSDTVSRQLRRVNLFIDPLRLFSLNLVVVVVVCTLTLLLTASIAATSAAALASGFLPRLTLRYLQRRRQAAFRAQLADLMMITAGGLRAGLSLGQSLAQTAAEIDPPARQEVDLMIREQRLGASFDQALAGLEHRMPLEETALFAAALRISRETGGNLAETLESLAQAMRRKVAIEGKIRALTAQGRLQGWAMGLLPAICAALLWMVEPDAMRALFTTWYGALTCVFVAIMQLLGLHFLRRVMRIDV
ncbi:MAG: type II secretion system F family protein [Burkholderiaceae bacterium]|nr:type II secretion system F family protein [Burkholderiaceae bacterium]